MPKEEKPLEEWFGLEKRKVKKALEDLKEFCPDIETLPEYKRAEKLFEFLKPNIKMPKKPEEQDRWAREGKWILPKNVRGYIEDSPSLETLIGTGWGNCYSLSILYAILAQHIGLKAKVLLLFEHAANRVYLKSKTVLLDVVNSIFDKKPQLGYKSCDSEFHYDSGYVVGGEFLVNWTKATGLTEEAEKETSESRKKRLLDDAIKLYDACIKMNPNDEEAWYNKGVAHDNKGENDLAIKCYERAIKINPNIGEAWYNKGVIHDNKGENDLAIKCFEKALWLFEKQGNEKYVHIVRRKLELLWWIHFSRKN